MTGTDLTNKTAIVTGASRGIGLASARALTAAGANVVVTARKRESADAAAASPARAERCCRLRRRGRSDGVTRPA